MASRSVSRERYSFANLSEPLELPDLIAVQRESFEWFLNEGLAETFRDISPIKDFSELMSYMVVNKNPGETITFTLLRDGRTLDIDVVLGFRE